MGSKKPIPRAPWCMNFPQNWGFTLPTSIGGFQGPQETQTAGQVCESIIMAMESMKLGAVRQSNVIKCPSWYGTVDQPQRTLLLGSWLPCLTSIIHNCDNPRFKSSPHPFPTPATCAPHTLPWVSCFSCLLQRVAPAPPLLTSLTRKGVAAAHG
jgi:hypothetical protein